MRRRGSSFARSNFVMPCARGSASASAQRSSSSPWGNQAGRSSGGGSSVTQSFASMPYMRRAYGIEAKLCVTEEPPPLERPAWFPQGEELERWAEAEADPRAHGITKFDLAKLDPRLLMQALRPY